MAAEVCDWHRFPTAGSFGAFCGLVPITHLSVWVPRTLSDQLERASGARGPGHLDDWFFVAWWGSSTTGPCTRTS
ncbi:MAG: transposase [Acidimicrobiales bacterium]